MNSAVGIYFQLRINPLQQECCTWDSLRNQCSQCLPLQQLSWFMCFWWNRGTRSTRLRIRRLLSHYSIPQLNAIHSTLYDYAIIKSPKLSFWVKPLQSVKLHFNDCNSSRLHFSFQLSVSGQGRFVSALWSLLVSRFFCFFVTDWRSEACRMSRKKPASCSGSSEWRWNLAERVFRRVWETDLGADGSMCGQCGTAASLGAGTLGSDRQTGFFFC